jgi:hypothetical protein
MASLFSMFRSLILMLCFSSSAAGALPCPLRVIVNDHDNQEIDADVRVVALSGRLHEKEYEAGGVEFCDLGIRPVAILVGRESSCNATTVRNVWLEFGEQRVVRVYFDVARCRVTLPHPPGGIYCKVFFRARDADTEELIPQARVAGVGKQSLTPDGRGGFYALVPLDSSVRFEASMEGYITRSIEAKCERGALRQDIEFLLER